MPVSYTHLIPITAFGFYALYELMQDKASVLAWVYKTSVYGYVAFGGAIHIICCYLVTGMKKALETGTGQESMLTAVSYTHLDVYKRQV